MKKEVSMENGKRIGFLVSDETAEKLERLAHSKGISMTAVIERLIAAEPLPRGRPRKKVRG